MKRPLLILSAALVGAACLPALAQQKPEAKAATMMASAPGTGTVTSAVSISARVEAIDKAQRQVTLKGPKGNVQTVTAGPEVRNFDQIKVGDMVVVRYLESLTLTLKKDGKELRSQDRDGRRRAGQGRREAGRHRGPAGRGHRRRDCHRCQDADADAEGPEPDGAAEGARSGQFKLVKVGDQIQAVYTEAVALSVEAAAPAKK